MFPGRRGRGGPLRPQMGGNAPAVALRVAQLAIVLEVRNGPVDPSHASRLGAGSFRLVVDSDNPPDSGLTTTEGVPIFLFRSEPFWGHDRLPVLEERLTGDPVATHVLIHAFNQWVVEHWSFNVDDRL